MVYALSVAISFRHALPAAVTRDKVRRSLQPTEKNGDLATEALDDEAFRASKLGRALICLVRDRYLANLTEDDRTCALELRLVLELGLVGANDVYVEEVRPPIHAPCTHTPALATCTFA